ncbi:MAG: peptidoglycan-associated lipoprotein Pal [Alphaproteobacteria bacterium]
MLKKLFAIVCAVSLLGACASKEQGADLYGDSNGGWQQNVNISDLKSTATTEQFADEVNAVVYFAFDSAALNAEAKTYLTEQAAWLKAHPRALIVIEGRCDERGTREYNQALGERRANAARSYLVAHGVEAKRIITISYGSEKPVVSGSTEEAYAKNRNATTVAY